MDLDIVTYGDLVVDALLPIPSLPIFPNQEQIAHGMTSEPGGMGNFLIMAARLGGKVAPAGILGDDPYGRLICEKLAAEGVDLSALRRIPGQGTTLILVFVSDAGEHVFVGVLGTARMDAGECQSVAERLNRARAFYTNGYAFLESDPPDQVVSLLATARRQGILAAFDPGPQVNSIERELMLAAIRETDLLLATSEEATCLTGEPGAKQAASALLALGPGTVVIKRGVEGCLVATGIERQSLPGFPVEVRDTAGAGDAFDAAFVLGRLRGLSLAQAGCLANAVGAAAVTQVGAGTRLPSRAAVMELLARNGISAPTL